MKPFTQIAVPHEDIIEGRLTMDIFAADLWQVANGKAPLDYQNPDFFFKKTYITKGLENILQIAKSRLEGKSGDAVIQLQTPFGGGKTHTLIALYHKAKEWNVNVVVFDGTALDPKEIKPWEELERQLIGKIEITKGDTAPGKEKLIKLLSANSPVLILMDEVLEYVTKAAGIKVGDSNLASQTLAFIQELTGAVSTLGNALLVITLSSSFLEHYDENAERFFHQLQKIVGRTEKIYTPVEDEEIASVVRARLFRKIDEEEVKKVVDEFVDYAINEGLLSKEEAMYYREKFLKSYPFKPEVIDVLYKRWGSFPLFHRTRGVLRLLSLVVHDLLEKNIPFIKLGDFNLENNEIKRELIKHIGPEWDGIIFQDITSQDSGAKKVDENLGSSYKSYKLGTVVSTTIFMTSFSGRGEKEISLKELKLYCASPEFSSTVIDNVVNHLKEKLFYLSDYGLFFTTQPNLNRMIITREDSISKDEIYEQEKEIIKAHISRHSKFKIFVHPKFHSDIPDTPELKLIILNKDRPEKEFLEKYGELPRIYRNTLVFLCMDNERKEAFERFLRKFIAIRSLLNDTHLALTEMQRKELINKLKSYEERECEELRKLYRKIFLPAKDGYKEIDIGYPTFGEIWLDKEIYEILRSRGEILERISPKVIKEKYMGEKEYIEIKKLYETFLKTPGELRIISEEGFKEAIKEGVKEGLFGYGKLNNGIIECECIYEIPEINFTEDEIIIKPELCEKKKKEIIEEIPTEEKELEIKTKEGEITKFESEEKEPMEKISSLSLKLNVPSGNISPIVNLVNSFISKRFNICNITVIIKAKEGEITLAEYENKIKEAIMQIGAKIEEENIEKK